MKNKSVGLGGNYVINPKSIFFCLIGNYSLFKTETLPSPNYICMAHKIMFLKIFLSWCFLSCLFIIKAVD